MKTKMSITFQLTFIQSNLFLNLNVHNTRVTPIDIDIENFNLTKS